LAAKLREEIADVEIDMIRGGGGDYIVIVDGEELWNKKSSGRGFPDEGVLVDEIVARAS